MNNNTLNGLLTENKWDIILYLNYLEKLEAKRTIQSDLSHFRTILGECDNLKQLIVLMEDCKFENGYICTDFNKLQDVQLKTEIFSLIDIGIVQISDDGQKVFIKPEFASWLLACVEETSDRISFVREDVGLLCCGGMRFQYRSVTTVLLTKNPQQQVVKRSKYVL